MVKWMTKTETRKNESFVPYKVKTPYGTGWVTSLKVNDDDGRMKRRIEVVTNNEYKTKMTLYSVEEYDVADAQEQDDVIVKLFGRGRVLREVTVRCRKKHIPGYEMVHKKFHVELSSWRLANGNRVKLYVTKDRDNIVVVKKKELHEMSIHERVDFAKRQRTSAVAVFKNKEYQTALNLYAGAIEALRYVQYNPTIDNYTRADALILLITCNNNAATCCANLLPKWKDAAIKYAKNALLLIDALHGKQGQQIHTLIQTRLDVPNIKLFGEWRVKSYLLLATVQQTKISYEPQVLEYCKKARVILTEYTNNKNDDATQPTSSKALKLLERQINKLMASTLEQKKLHHEKEKARAKAMFGGGSTTTTTKSQPKQLSNGKKSTTTNPKPIIKPSKPLTVPTKNVTFTGETKPPVGDFAIGDSIDTDEEEEEPWYSDHKEALILLAAGGLATLSFMLLRKK